MISTLSIIPKIFTQNPSVHFAQRKNRGNVNLESSTATKIEPAVLESLRAIPPSTEWESLGTKPYDCSISKDKTGYRLTLGIPNTRRPNYFFKDKAYANSGKDILKASINLKSGTLINTDQRFTKNEHRTMINHFFSIPEIVDGIKKLIR